LTVPRIYELADTGFPVTLAVSLHATDDGTRRHLMPVAHAYTMAETLAACVYYAEKTRRRVTVEYALIRGLNDTDTCAHALCGLLRGALFHVNLLPVNSVHPGFLPSRRVRRFSEILTRRGLAVTIRHSLGSDIDAACGQLRLKFLKK
jgi:23S rRNA (adenine2503-C2)-methyltransferase